MDGNMLNALIVEDNTDFRQVLATILKVEFTHLRIVEATDAEQALEKVETTPPDLAFVDIRLPGMNGLNLAKELRQRFRDVVIIVLTSYDTPEYREAATLSKVDHFLLKGSSTHYEVLELVKSILANRPAE
jgi:two-component system response regulator YesN